VYNYVVIINGIWIAIIGFTAHLHNRIDILVIRSWPSSPFSYCGSSLGPNINLSLFSAFVLQSRRQEKTVAKINRHYKGD
jgi:hypothetical protein